MVRRAIVVGGGLGGLASAIRLQSSGWQVTLLEKNERVGGRCNVLTAGGFTFDMGPTLLLMPDVLRKLFASAGRDLEDYLDLLRVHPNYRLHFGDGSTLDVSSDLAATGRQLDSMEEGAGDALRRYVDDAGYKYRVSRERFVERNFAHWYSFATPASLYYLFTTNTLRKLDKHVGRYFRDGRLGLGFTFQSMYLGLAPRDAPSVYALLPYTELEEGIWYPRGGMYQIPNALRRLAEELGVEVRTGIEVTSLETQGRRVSGVKTVRGDVLEADVVVVNADLPYAYQNLLPQERRGRFTDRAIRNLDYGSSGFLMYLGVDRVFPEFLHHNAYLSSDPDENFDAIFTRREVPGDPSFYVCAPGRNDATLAPPGSDALYILVPAPRSSDTVNWQVEAPRLRRKVLDRLARAGIEDLEEHIVFERHYTPDDFVADYNTMCGNAFGISHKFSQVGYLRPANKAREVDNLYFVGASTAPGGGVPMVMIGSELVAERVTQDWGHG